MRNTLAWELLILQQNMECEEWEDTLRDREQRNRECTPDYQEVDIMESELY